MAQPYAAGDIRVANARFEEGLLGWDCPEGASIEASAGGAVLRLTVEAGVQERGEGVSSVEASEQGQGEHWAISSPVPVEGGRVYYAYAACREERGAGAIALRFYDAAGRALAAAEPAAAGRAPHAAAGLAPAASAGWRTLGAGAAAPAGAVALRVALGAKAVAAGAEPAAEVRFSDVRLTDKLTALGAQVTNATIHAATLGKDAAGRDTVYLVADGSVNCSARLVAVNANDGATVGVWDLPRAAGGWAATTAQDGSIYVGSYENALLYRYVPGDADITVVGTPREGENFIFSLTPGKGEVIYGGTYPGALLFRYAPSEGFTLLGPAPLQEGESYARDVVYDADREALYCGIGSHAFLKRFDLRTGEVAELLPEEYRGEQFVYDVNIEGGYLFVRVQPSSRMLVFQLDGCEAGKPELVTTVEGFYSLGVSPLYDGYVYYAGKGSLWRYNLATKQAEPTGVKEARTIGQFVTRLDDQAGFPGNSLIGVGSSNGRTMLTQYNAKSGAFAVLELDFPEAPANLVSIVQGPNGNIYTSGFLVGGHAEYAPMTGTSVQCRGVMQSENMAELDGKLYFGVYPGARMFEYDPKLPWDADKGGQNPRLMFELKSEEQDRPFGMTTGEGKLFIGTVSGYGKLGGALTIYDPQTGQYDFYRHLVPDQSLITLAYRDGDVYAGSSIWGGIGITPSQTDAKLLRFNTSTRTSEVISLPVTGLKALTALTFDEAGLLWGMAEGYVFAYDPSANAFVHFEHVFKDMKYGERFVWRDATLLQAADGCIYGTAKAKYLFRIHPGTREIEVLREDGAKFLAEDRAFGHLYYVFETELRRYVL